MRSKNRHVGVILLGSIGFPFGSATIQRQIQLAKSLLNANFKVCVINNRSSHPKFISKRENIKTLGNYQNVNYFYSSLITFKPTNFILRYIVKIIGAILEILTIIYLRIFKNYKYFLLRTDMLKDIKYYSKVSKLIGIELIYDYVEYYDSTGKRDLSGVKKHKKDSFDYNFINYVDKVIVISKFLENHVKSINVEIPTIKIPPIIDFDYFNNIYFKKKSEQFFLFCGSIAYLDLIEFIINSYILSNASNNDIKLKLVINGDDSHLQKLNKFVNDKQQKKNITILTKLPYIELIQLYKSAKALLIPIGNNLQDDARFPFKICEYTASKRPIITSDSGAILEFFEDDNNALIAKSEDLNDFASKINKIIEQPEAADRIGESGYNLGSKIFNYNTYSQVLRKLIVAD